ncbi:MAG: glycoside hydrolase family 15 protein [Phycisphaerales bacterium]|nr:glycoside hydrolase family 15 protein [Phycisphaerales bacterium]
MPRDIPVGNGELLVTFDATGQVRDLYWPHVGLPNHTDGHVQRLGVWADGAFAWFDDEGWQRDLRYRHDTLVTDVTLTHEGLGLEIRCVDAVDCYNPVYLRRVEVRDLSGRDRDVRIFLHQDLSIGGTPVGGTANYDPKAKALVHYRDGTYFLINGCDASKCGIDHFTTGIKRIGGAEGTWRDAEDGQLTQNAIAQGLVDSTVGFNLQVQASGRSHLVYWVACASSYEAARALNQKVLDRTADHMIERTASYWRLWALKEGRDLSSLPDRVRDLHVRSELVVRTQIDNGGAILAANDSDIRQFAGDTYSYMWPRDGALVSQALVLGRQGVLSRRFFRFCARVIDPEGYFLHKFNPTGTLASSWHPWILDGEAVLPIQEDETALVTWALRQHFDVFRDVEFAREMMRPLILNPAKWMLSYRDENGLPLPSWDLWEERRGIHLFTTATVIAGLEAAAFFAGEFHNPELAQACTDGADEMREALMRHFWSEEHGHFARMLTPTDGGYDRDMTLDASAWGLFATGAIDVDDPRLSAHLAAVDERLTVKTEVGGVARYEHDYYHQVESEDIDRVPGNPWIICTLWRAQWIIARATTLDALKEALEPLEWTAGNALPSGVLAEQLDPYTGAPLSVSPLTWSHATVMTTVALYLRRQDQLSN